MESMGNDWKWGSWWSYIFVFIIGGFYVWLLRILLR